MLSQQWYNNYRFRIKLSFSYNWGLTNKWWYFISQKYVIDILKQFKMELSTTIYTPIIKWLETKKKDTREFINLTYFKGIMGSIHYLIIYCLWSKNYQSIYGKRKKRLTITLTSNKAFGVYINGTHDHKIFHSHLGNFNLVNYKDSNWGDDMDILKKNSDEYVFPFFNLQNGSILMVFKDNKL